VTSSGVLPVDDDDCLIDFAYSGVFCVSRSTGGHK
jgi:hypothetical protein